MHHPNPQHLATDLTRSLKRQRGPSERPFRGGRPSQKSQRQRARQLGRELETLRDVRRAPRQDTRQH